MDDLFFYTAKLVWLVISPDSLFVILLVIGWLWLLMGKKRKALVLLGVLTFGSVLVSVWPVGDWMLYPLESRFQHNPPLPEKVDGIIVLGGSVLPAHSQEWQQLETNDYHERLSAFIALAKHYPEARLIFSGGNAHLSGDEPSEAEMVRDYFIESGIDEARLTLESESRNTAENVALSKQRLQPRREETWVLITTAYHMPRSVGIFCRQHWPVIPYPVDHKTVPSKRSSIRFDPLGHLNQLVIATHEWLGLVAYYGMAKTDQLFPAGCR